MIVQPWCVSASCDTISRSIRIALLMFPMTTYRQHHKRARILAVGFVLLYALASGRSFVPGMCATQSAVVSGGASLSPLACCARPASAPNHSNGSNTESPVPRCAFCQLVLAACTTTPYATDGSAIQPITPYKILNPAVARSTAVLDTNVGRDPPRQHLS